MSGNETESHPEASEYVPFVATPYSRTVVETLISMAEPLAVALGHDSEVVIHDLSLMPDTIVAVGGKLTGRGAGGPITNLLLEHVRSGRTDDLLRYETRMDDGRIFRSSTVFVRDARGIPFASLCTNTDITEWTSAQKLLAAFTLTGPVDRQPVDSFGESFSSNIGELSEHLIRRALDKVGAPVELMQKPHKIAVVRDLDRQGFFLIRDSIDAIAQVLGVTRFTIYNYLNQIRET